MMGGLTLSRPTIILFTCCLSLFMIFMDATIVNVALPTIRESFQASTTDLQWTIDAYTLVVASFLLLAGSMADRFGRRRVFQIGMACFSIGSALCGLAPSIHWLIVFRIVQAIGGAMLNPVAMAIITNTFVEPRERARAIGVWGAVAGIAMAIGPAAGGLLTQFIGWRSIFWVNLPFGVLAIVCAALFIPESKAARSRGIDLVGQVFVVVALACLMASVIEGPRLGWRSVPEMLLLLGTIAAVAGILIYEPRRRDPLVDVALFRSVPFSGAVAMAVCCFASFGALLFLASLILQELKGYSAAEAGLALMPLAVGMIAFAPLSGRLVGRWGPRPSVVGAGIAIAASALMLTQLRLESPLWYFLIAITIFGIGFGLINTPITYTAVSGLPLDRAGVAAAFASASRQTGTSLGVALAGTLGGASALADHRLDTSVLDNSLVVWWLIFATGLFVIALGFISTSKWGVGTSRHTAELFAK